MTAETHGVHSFTGTDWSAPRDVAYWTHRLSFDIIGDICYGNSFRDAHWHQEHFHTPAAQSREQDYVYQRSDDLASIIKCWLHFIAFLP